MPIRGVSLLPHLKSGGKVQLADRPLFWDLYGRMAAVEGPWKIVANGPNHHGHFSKTIPAVEQTDFELYNLDQDIGETTNLAQTHTDVYRRLKGHYVGWFKEMAINYDQK
jgi:arylsulfatase A-like enzyme